MELLLPISGAGLFIWLYRKQILKKPMLRILLLLSLGATLLTGYEMLRGDYADVGDWAQTMNKEGSVSLRAEVDDGTEHEVVVQTPTQPLTEESAKDAFSAVKDDLEKLMLGKNTDGEHVCYDLDFFTDVQESDVTIGWSVQPAEMIRYDGRLSSDIPEGGVSVQVSATLYLDMYSDTVIFPLYVYPSKEEHSFDEAVQKEVDRTGELPEEVRGNRISWYRRNEKTGVGLSLLVLVIGVLLIFSDSSKKKELAEKRVREMERDYPGIIGKMQLLLAAGLSVRKSFERMASDYQVERRHGSKEKPAYEELVRICKEMANGVTEQEAYRLYAQRCGTASYKNLSVLLSQNQKRGGAMFLQMLEAESVAALELRKRRAREAGEKASVRLVLPMGLLLLVVLLIILVPAMVSL